MAIALARAIKLYAKTSRKPTAPLAAVTDKRPIVSRASHLVLARHKVPAQPIVRRRDAPVAPATFVSPVPLVDNGDAAASAPHAAPHADMAHGLSPIDLPEPEGGEQGGLGWMTGIILLSSALLLLFNSFAVDKWARAMTPTAQTMQLVDTATAWHAAMQRFGLTVPLESGRSAYHWVRDVTWPGDGGDAAAAAVAPDEAAEPTR